MVEIEIKEVTFPDWPKAPEIPEGMKRVEVKVYWRREDYNTYDVPKDTELSDIRDAIVYDTNSFFDSDNAWLTEFEVWTIRDDEGDEEWWI